MAQRGVGLYEAKNGSWKLDCWIHAQRLRKSFGRIPEKLARGSGDRRAVAQFEGYETDEGLPFVAERLRVLANVGGDDLPT